MVRKKDKNKYILAYNLEKLAILLDCTPKEILDELEGKLISSQDAGDVLEYMALERG